MFSLLNLLKKKKAGKVFWGSPEHLARFDASNKESRERWEERKKLAAHALSSKEA